MITRNNYEAIFIDYLEGTLSAGQVADVLLFLEQNPDLAQELEGLEQVHLLPDQSELFPGKKDLRKSLMVDLPDELEWLLAGEAEGTLSVEEMQRLEEYGGEYGSLQVHRTAYSRTHLIPTDVLFEDKASLRFPEKIDALSDEALLIGSTEGDLDSRGQQLLNERLLIHPELTKELELFKKVRLTAPIIPFEGKKSLHKQERGRLVWMRFATAAVAAAAALLFFWFRPDPTATGTGFAMKSLAIPLPSPHPLTPPSTEVLVPGTSMAPHSKTERNNQLPAVQDVITTPLLSFETMSSRLLNWAPVAMPDPALAYAPMPMQQIFDHPNAESLASSTDPGQGKFLTIRDFLEEKVKSELWGDNRYPEKNYTLALAQKTADKVISRREGRVELERVHTQDEKSIRLRIGKFEFLRKR